MDKKVTVRDVAKAAGVSVATVSYIMNDRTDQKISPETKKKVLQIANLLNYRPSHAAKSLATGRNNIIGVAYTLKEGSPSRNIEISRFVNLLIERFNRMSYDVLYLSLPVDETPTISRNIDAIIAIDLPHDLFKRLANECLVPIIGVDMLIQDDLFYQIYTDYPSLFQKAAFDADTCLIMDAFSNQNYQDYIAKGIPNGHILFYHNITPDVLRGINASHIVIMGTQLALMVLPYLNGQDITVIRAGQEHDLLPSSIRCIPYALSKKANLTINILLNALDRNFELNHDLKLSD